jgi:hypothetical protein
MTNIKNVQSYSNFPQFSKMKKKKTSRQNIKSRRFGKFYFQKTTYLQAKLKSSSLCPAVSAGGSQAKQDRN